MTNLLIPQALLFGQEVNAGACHTWLQLAGLADETGCTPPLDLDELSRWTGKSLATLYRHLGLLKQAGVLDWIRDERVIRVSLLCQASAGAGGDPPGGSQSCDSQNCNSQNCNSQDYDTQDCDSQNCNSTALRRRKIPRWKNSRRNIPRRKPAPALKRGRERGKQESQF